MSSESDDAEDRESGFRSQLQVAHLGGHDWLLTAPLIYEGTSQFFIISEGFQTDFASIPRLLRWLFDNAGHNAQAGVLHDVLWRASKNGDERVDAWNADALFRRALRQSGATSLTRGMMWAAVRVVALAQRRVGSPSHIGPIKRFASLLIMGCLGVLTAGPAFLVVGVATLIYWLISWIVAIICESDTNATTSQNKRDSGPGQRINRARLDRIMAVKNRARLIVTSRSWSTTKASG